LKHKKLSKAVKLEKNEIGFACDGDGDRIILFYKKDHVRILNGDKILGFLCLGFKNLINKFPILSQLKIGAISTLYSDGNLKLFVENLGIPYYIEPTGVKNMFQRTSELDISFLVEFNGHALILFSEKAKKMLLENESTRDLFRNIFDLNCDSGDFMSVFFILQFLMKFTNLGFEDIDKTFKDKFTSLLQVNVTNKNIVQMDERSGIHHYPEDLPVFIQGLMKQYKKERLRIFIRKSGTEEIVRILLECESQDVIDLVSPIVEKFVRDHSEINP
jgi:phosphoacetylglucosamine mutase